MAQSYNHLYLAADLLRELSAKDEAFGDALVELFRRHPAPELIPQSHRAVRGSVLRKARAGGYRPRVRTWSETAMTGYRELLVELAPDWCVPTDELLTIHMLIYG